MDLCLAGLPKSASGSSSGEHRPPKFLASTTCILNFENFEFGISNICPALWCSPTQRPDCTSTLVAFFLFFFVTSHRRDSGDEHDQVENNQPSQLRPSPGDVKGGITHHAYQTDTPAACEGASRQGPKQNDHKSLYHSHVICAG